MSYLCCSIFSLAGTTFLLCMGALLRLQPEFIRDVHTPKSSANSCFVSAGLYAGVFVGSMILWRREQHVKGSSSVGEIKDDAPFELYATPLMRDNVDEAEPQRRVPSSSVHG
ncbi:hypothetical protein H310_02923 [Aphanomyces invadans]|uniref:Uncharacterized protein n=1 Tax=Aphanomyces invadans TaxID=157072 RepID=A0A024UKD2_9STRA|nr:hypothetical protein H310_02923 [Aphanomyces invadans]ETW06764.1 hypothetical protein H310_02923 [Aphanomyces invadans]|eukprot:XP_008864839.1 hypothetical protein H310_02923 [Aphanomyces invadans]